MENGSISNRCIIGCISASETVFDLLPISRYHLDLLEKPSNETFRLYGKICGNLNQQTLSQTGFYLCDHVNHNMVNILYKPANCQSDWILLM